MVDSPTILSRARALKAIMAPNIVIPDDDNDNNDDGDKNTIILLS
jgi:hypothetical protein